MNYLVKEYFEELENLNIKLHALILFAKCEGNFHIRNALI